MATNRVKLEDVINQANEVLKSSNPDYVVALCRYIFKYYPRTLEATRLLGEAYTEKKEKKLLEEADQLFTYVLAADPHNVLVYVDRGFIATERGSIDEAIRYYERAIEIDPSIGQLRSELLHLYKQRSGNHRVRVRLTKAGLANYRMRDGFYNQAIEEYRAVLNETPDRLDLQAWLMEAYWRNRDYARAEKLASELLQNHPYLIKANLILWHIYGVRRHQARADSYLEKAYALDPFNLIAERLFENSPTQDHPLIYISTLGVATIPAFNPETLEQESAGESLLPLWVTADPETDRRLGLRGLEEPLSQEKEQEPLTTFPDLTEESDWLSKLLAETEHQLEVQEVQSQITTPLEEVSPAQAHTDAQADLASFRQSQGDDFFGTLFEEIKETPVEFNSPASLSIHSLAAVPLDLDLEQFNPAQDITIKPFNVKAEDSTLDRLFEELVPPPNSQPKVSLDSSYLEDDSSFEPTLKYTPSGGFGAKAETEPSPFDFDFGEAAVPFTFEAEAKPEPIEPFHFDNESQPFIFKTDTGSDFDLGPEPFTNPENAPLTNANSSLGSFPDDFQMNVAFELLEFGRTENTAIRPDKLARTEHPLSALPTFDLNDLELDETDLASIPLQDKTATSYEPEISASKSEAERGYGVFVDDLRETEQYDVDLFAPTLLPSQFLLTPEPEVMEPLMQVESDEYKGEVVEAAKAERPFEASTESGFEVEPLSFFGSLEPATAQLELYPADKSYVDSIPPIDSSLFEAESLEPMIALPLIHHAPESKIESSRRLDAHAFHRRDERGLVPPAIAHSLEGDYYPGVPLERAVASLEGGPIQATSELNLTPVTATAITGTPVASTDQKVEAIAAPGIEPSDKESEAMPIKRGGQDDDSNVFDWEKEELPDYLRDFALDEEEVAQKGWPLNPPITRDIDMTTGPARIRPRDPEPATPGDLPEWINPSSNRQPPQINMATGDQIRLSGGGTRPIGSGGSLPNWLDASEQSAPPDLGRPAIGLPGLDDLDLDGL
ncbi:MAG: tetratricopeptide repeat protein [Chloroflexota bacterium]